MTSCSLLFLRNLWESCFLSPLIHPTPCTDLFLCCQHKKRRNKTDSGTLFSPFHPRPPPPFLFWHCCVRPSWGWTKQKNNITLCRENCGSSKKFTPANGSLFTACFPHIRRNRSNCNNSRSSRTFASGKKGGGEGGFLLLPLAVPWESHILTISIRGERNRKKDAAIKRFSSQSFSPLFGYVEL